MTLLRWIMFFPLGLIGACIWSALLLKGGYHLVGNWMLPSGLVIYAAAGLFPATTVFVGLQVAPQPSRRLQWILLSPHLCMAILLVVPLLVGFIFFSSSMGEIFQSQEFNISFSRSLSRYWQFLLYSVGYLSGIIFSVSQEIVDILRPPDE